MESEATLIITSVFKKSGRKKLSSSDFFLTLSMDLGWFPPAEAKKFVKWAEENNLLKRDEEDLLTPTFDLKTIDIPIDFQPSMKKWIPNRRKPLRERLIEYIEKNSGIEDIEEKINDIMVEKKIFFEVAALFIGIKLNIDMSRFFDEVERYILHNEIEGNRE